jgi:hypothetical protein
VIERLALIAVLALSVALAVRAVRTLNARRQRELRGTHLLHHLNLKDDARQRPTLVTFSTPSCAACHQAQAPAVRAAAERVEVRCVDVDAAQQPDVARAFGVLTVPATAILTPSGRLHIVNQGFAPTARLVEQIRAA